MKTLATAIIILLSAYCIDLVVHDKPLPFIPLHMDHR